MEPLKIGDLVRVTRRRLGHTVCVGMEGTVTEFNDRPTPFEQKNNTTETKYVVKATNAGPAMRSEKSLKKVRAWLPENRCTFYADELQKLN